MHEIESNRSLLPKESIHPRFYRQSLRPPAFSLPSLCILHFLFLFSLKKVKLQKEIYGMEDQQEQKDIQRHSSANIAPPPQPHSPAASVPKLSVHSGNGKLRGGGVRAVPKQSKVERLFSRLERRLGLAMALCMAILLCALVINGLFHDKVRATVTQLIEAVEREVRVIQHHEIVLFTDTFSTESFTGSEREIGEEEGTENGTQLVNNTTDGEREVTTRDAPNGNGNFSLMTRFLRMRADQLTELNAFRQRFADADIAMWLLVLLNLLGLVVLVPLMCHFCSRKTNAKAASKSCCFAFRVLLVLLVLLSLLQLFLLFSLLDNALKFPSIIDKLFGFYLDEVPAEKRAELVEPAEDQFSCKVKVEHEVLEQYGLQEKCVPKMKDSLLSSSIVIFLILVTLFPFFLSICTCFWPKHFKILAPFEKAHRKVMFFQTEERAQNRSQILINAMGTTKWSRPKEAEENPKMLDDRMSLPHQNSKILL